MSRYGIICLEEELQGNEIILEPNEKVVIGRDAKVANLVFRDMTISRIHCAIEVQGNGLYSITNYSMNGTQLENGLKLLPGTSVTASSGSILMIGKSGTKLQLE